MEELQKQINSLKQQISELSAEVYKNNFRSHQDFNKACYFNSKLKVPNYSSVPSTGEVGEIIEVNGILLICETANNFVVVGTQS